VVGRERDTLVCELLGEARGLPPYIAQSRDTYEEALRAYVDGQFAAAAAGFRAASALWPEDRAAVEMAERAEMLAREPVPSGWRGIYAQTAKL
jgi:hypothetical protein